VKNATASKYKYLHDASGARPAFLRANSTLVVAVPSVDARLDKLIAVVTTKFMQSMQTVIATTADVAHAFGARQFPSITLLRVQDDHKVTFPGEPAKAAVKSLMDFVGRNIRAKYELMLNFKDQGDDVFFTARSTLQTVPSRRWPARSSTGSRRTTRASSRSDTATRRSSGAI
jgi:hypothetical protein